VPERSPIYRYTLQSHDFWVWENVYARPYAYFATRFQAAESEEVVQRRLRALTFDRVNEVQIEDFERSLPPDVAGLHTGRPVTEAERDSIKLESYAPGKMAFSLTAEVPRFMVVNEGWTPAWRAYIDGSPVPIYRANYIAQGIVVPTGSHQVTFQYDPPGFKWGIGITLGALALWLALVGFAVRERMRRAAGDKTKDAAAAGS
jgi:hypothetical protein